MSGVCQVARVAEDVERLSADGRQEDFEVAARDQLRIHAARLFEERAAQVAFAHVEAPGHARQPPHRLDGDLGHHRRAVVEQHLAVCRQALEGDRLPHLRQVDVGLGHGNRRADVVALRDEVGKHIRHRGAPRVDGHHLGGVAPLRIRPDQVGRRGVGEVGAVAFEQVARGHRERAVHAVRPGVRADDVALASIDGGAHHRAALCRGGRTPADGRRAAGALLAGVGREPDVPRARCTADLRTHEWCPDLETLNRMN